MHRREEDEEEDMFVMREEGGEAEAGDEEMMRRMMMMGGGETSYTHGIREEEDEDEADEADDDISSLFDSQGTTARDRRPQRARERERERERLGWRTPFSGFRPGTSGSYRRGTQSETPPPPSHQATPNVPSSRTFLIYVIGGMSASPAIPLFLFILLIPFFKVITHQTIVSSLEVQIIWNRLKLCCKFLRPFVFDGNR